MSYSVYQILNKCPEIVKINGEDKIIYEFCIKDFKKYFNFFYTLFKDLSKERIKEFKDDDNLINYLKYVYSQSPRPINQILNIMYPDIQIKEDVFNKKYVDILFKAIKQNDILDFLTREIEDISLTTLDEYDTIFKIIVYKIIDITFLNYDLILTYKQLKFYSEKINNFEKSMMFNFYLPVRKCLSEMFADGKTQQDSFYDTLFKTNKIIKNERIINTRKRYFHEKFEDIDFIIKTCKEKKLDPLLFFEYDEAKKIFEDKVF